MTSYPLTLSCAHIQFCLSQGLIRNTSIHAGIRAPLAQPKGDIRNDERCGFARITARDLDRIGVSGIVSRIRERVTGPVYISVDIDVLDPAFAPGIYPSLFYLLSFLTAL